MEAFKDFRKAGVFQLTPQTQVHGELILSGEKTTLEIFSREAISTRAMSDHSITGVLRDGTKVSLTGCIDHGSGSNSRGSETFHVASIFPHFALFGDEHISASDKKIFRVSFLISDAPAIFYDFDAFGGVYHANEIVAEIAKSKEASGRPIFIGESPMVFYFNGRHQLASVETVLGTVSVGHSLNVQSPGPTGISVANKTFVTAIFQEPAAIAGAIDIVQTLIRFLDVIAGRPQRILRLIFDVSADPQKPRELDVYWSMSAKQESASERLHPADVPIRAAQNPRHFESVLKEWLERNDAWRSARFRFASSYEHQNSFTIERLVGAANMFDILPSSAVPSVVNLPEDVAEAAQICRKAFEKVADGPERQSILGALGRLKKVGLRLKIQSRAKVLTDLLPGQLQDLDFVIKEAVACRNYFVHGSKSKIDYERNFDPVIFFIETLEFVFAASDLVECGWDISEWWTRASSLSHPFARYRDSYAAALTSLKQDLIVSEMKKQG